MKVNVTVLVVTFIAILIAFTDGAYIHILPTGGSITKPVGGITFMTCEVRDMPPQVDPFITWYDNNNVPVDGNSNRVFVEKENEGQVAKLYINGIIATDRGTYTCRAEVEGNQLQESIMLELFQDITFVDAPENQFPIAGTEGLIKCVVEGQPVPTVSWRYRNQRIPVGGRYAYTVQGLIIQSVTEEDNGKYTCVAEVDVNGRIAVRDISVIVYTSPVITQELGQSGGVEKQEVSISCRASGNPQPRYTFYKDGQDFPVIDTDVIDVDAVGGNIHFRPLDRQNEGSYRCVASNEAGDAETSGALKVIIPPKVLNYRNITVQEGQPATLTCEVEGDPVANIRFRKAETGTDYMEGENEGGRIFVHQVRDNQLEIQFTNTIPTDASNYTCIAENEGGFYEQNGTLLVEFAPYFPEDHITHVYNWPGKTRNITCNSFGYPEPLIRWWQYGKELRTNETFKIYEMGRNSVLQVYVREVDVNWIFGSYTCESFNGMGAASIDINLERATVPAAPAEAGVKELTSTRVVLTVKPPDDDGGVPVFGYRIQYDVYFQDFLLHEEMFIEHLNPSTSYTMLIYARNDVGLSPRLEITFETEPVRAPYALRIVSDPAGRYPYTYTVRWEKPDTGGNPIYEYEFRYKRVESFERNKIENEIVDLLDDWNRMVVKDNEESPMLFYTLEFLKPDSTYALHIRAWNNVGWSPDHDQFVFTTSQDPDAGGSTQAAVGLQGNIVTIVTTLLFYHMVTR